VVKSTRAPGGSPAAKSCLCAPNRPLSKYDAGDARRDVRPRILKGADLVAASAAIAGNAAKLPPDLSHRVIAEHEPPIEGEAPFALNRAFARNRRSSRSRWTFLGRDGLRTGGRRPLTGFFGLNRSALSGKSGAGVEMGAGAIPIAATSMPCKWATVPEEPAALGGPRMK
jgi:hypothetical protein